MSSSRRKFLQTAAFGSAAVLSGTNIIVQNKKIHLKKDSPVVVSTWEFVKLFWKFALFILIPV
jgi:hypothetical protein